LLRVSRDSIGPPAGTLIELGVRPGVLRVLRPIGGIYWKRDRATHRPPVGGRHLSHDEGLSSSRRRNWALMATMTVEALMRAAAAAGASTIPAQARAPAASGMARTL
jgi:hypothetical protein